MRTLEGTARFAAFTTHQTKANTIMNMNSCLKLMACALFLSGVASLSPAGAQNSTGLAPAPNPPAVTRTAPVDKAGLDRALESSSKDPAFLKALVNGNSIDLTKVLRNECPRSDKAVAAAGCGLTDDSTTITPGTGSVDAITFKLCAGKGDNRRCWNVRIRVDISPA